MHLRKSPKRKHGEEKRQEIKNGNVQPTYNRDSKRESRENVEKAIIKTSWFPNLKKVVSTQVKGVYWFLCRINKHKYTLRHISIMKPQKLYRAKPNQNKTHKTRQNMKSY